MIRKVVGIYYSPAGGTAGMTERLARQVSGVLDDSSPEDIGFECHDMAAGEDLSALFDDETVAVIGMPVYMGKLPLPAARTLSGIRGSGAMTLAAVSYGGMTYGNALYELRHCAEEAGFRVIGAGAFLISYAAVRGSQRSAGPRMDAAALGEFGQAASEKIKRLSGSDIEGLRIKPAPVEVRGRMPAHKISRISPRAAAIAQGIVERLSLIKHRSEWFL